MQLTAGVAGNSRTRATIQVDFHSVLEGFLRAPVKVGTATLYK